MRSIEEKRKDCRYGLYDYLSKRAADASKRFLFTENESYTYKQIKTASEILAVRLFGVGINRGTLVAVRATRTTETVVVFFALNIVGAVAVMTDPHDGIREYIKNSGVAINPEFYITDEGGGWVLKNNSFNDVTSLPFEFTSDDDGATAKKLADCVSVTDPSLIIFTSGSTGAKKAVTLCQRNLVTNSVDGSDVLGETSEDTNALVLPLNHVFGLALIVCALISGHDVYIPPRVCAEELLSDIKKYGINILYSVPTFILQLNECAKKFGAPQNHKFVLLAGGPSTEMQVTETERVLNTKVLPVYGMSEFIGITCGGSLCDKLRRSGVGAFYPLNEGMIADENGNPLPDGEEGEVCVRGWDLMLGYYADEAETAKAIDKNGFLHTGDLGYLDENQVLHLTGRKKEIIIRAGENISARKIELALLDIKETEQAAVISHTHSILGEVPVAAVILKEGFNLSEQQIKEALKQALSAHEIPERILFMKSFPLTSSGKVDKLTLAEIFKTI